MEKLIQRSCIKSVLQSEKDVSCPILGSSSDVQYTIKSCKKRWLILFFYVYLATVSCFQWIEYSIIANIVTKYYSVSYSVVDWTSMVYMIVWPIFVFPSSYLIDKLGLRFAAIAGCLLTATGTLVKLFSIHPDAIIIVLVGQSLLALSQVFILTLPPKLAVTWFNANEISSVCSLGVFGMQFGCALGFLIPPILVKDSDNLDEIGKNLQFLTWGLSAAIIPVTICVLIYFPHQPIHPPSYAQAEERSIAKEVNFCTFVSSLKKLLANANFVLHLLSFSICYGVFSVFGTLLNQFIIFYFPGAQEDAGRMGLLMILVGMFGCGLVGFILDRFHKYKETVLVIFLMSSISIAVFLFALELKSKILVYVSIAIFGFFLNAYIPAGIEFATELTYPSNESTTTGLLTASSQVLAVLFTLILSFVNKTYGTFWAVGSQVILLGIGTVLTALVRNKRLRQEANSRAQFCEISQEEPKKMPT